MPRLLDTEDRVGLVVAVVNDLLAEHGSAGLTMRRIAAGARLSPAALTDHFGGRDRMLMLVAHRTGQARHRGLEWAARQQPPGLGALALLPADLDDVVVARAWLAWCELARCDDAIGAVVGEAQNDEHHLLASVLGEPGEGRVDMTGALVEGLRVAVCRPVRPMALQRAHHLLSEFVGAAVRVR